MPQEPEPREPLNSQQGTPPHEESMLEFHYEAVGLKWIALGCFTVIVVMVVAVRLAFRFFRQ